MKGLICWLDGFRETWLDPSMWRHHWRLLLRGQSVTVSGHLWDTDRPRYDVDGDRQYKYLTCDRCGLEKADGWSRFWGVMPEGQVAK